MSNELSVYELGHESEREDFDSWLAEVMQSLYNWELANEIQNHTSVGDLVVWRNGRVDIFTPKDLTKTEENAADGGVSEERLRMECLMAMDGDVDRARAAYDWIKGKN